MDDIRITAEPTDNHRCTFTLSVPLLDSGARAFRTEEEALGSPLAEAILSIENVTELLVSGPTVTVTKSDTAPWQVAGRAVGTAIRQVLQSGVPPFAARAVPAGPGDDALFDKVSLIFETRINPMVAGHGGRVDLIDIQDAVVMVRLAGGCQGCGMAAVTLRQGIETTLRQIAPEIRGIVDVTDHGSGANPYFAAAKK
jgi:Fe-S cluster biogenesis protein NfuA